MISRSSNSQVVIEPFLNPNSNIRIMITLYFTHFRHVFFIIQLSDHSLFHIILHHIQLILHTQAFRIILHTYCMFWCVLRCRRSLKAFYSIHSLDPGSHRGGSNSLDPLTRSRQPQKKQQIDLLAPPTRSSTRPIYSTKGDQLYKTF